MPWNVSGFCPQTLAFAPNVEHWDMRSLDKPLLIWPTSRRSCKLRSHIADGLTMRALYPDIGIKRSHGQSDRKSTRLNSSHVEISYAVFCLKKKKVLYLLLTMQPVYSTRYSIIPFVSYCPL